jgi:hypothetical protein
MTILDPNKITPQDPDFKAAFPKAITEAKSEAKEMKRIGHKWGSGNGKREWVRRRALAIALDVVAKSRVKSTDVEVEANAAQEQKKA